MWWVFLEVLFIYFLFYLVLSRDVETQKTALLMLPSESRYRKYRFKEDATKDSGLITSGEV